MKHEVQFDLINLRGKVKLNITLGSSKRVPIGGQYIFGMPLWPKLAATGHFD